jgi:hypothetical protein
MTTELRRFNLATTADLEKAVSDLCTGMAAGGLKLVSTFVFQTELILIFQGQ